MIAHLIRRILSTLSQAGARILNPGGVRSGAARPRSGQDGRAGGARAPGPCPAAAAALPGPARPYACPRGPERSPAPALPGTGQRALRGRQRTPSLRRALRSAPGVRELPAARALPPAPARRAGSLAAKPNK